MASLNLFEQKNQFKRKLPVMMCRESRICFMINIPLTYKAFIFIDLIII